MFRPSFLLLATTIVAWPVARAQDSTRVGACASPDSVAIRGNSRVSESKIRGDAGLVPGPLNAPAVQRAIKNLFATGDFDDVRVSCTLGAAGRTLLAIEVVERPILGDVDVTGVKRLSSRTVKEKVDLLIGRPIDPDLVARAQTRIDSMYEAEGYYLAKVRPETTVVNGKTKLTFVVDEGRRLAISGIRISGNRNMPASEIARAMKSRPEGFWWFRKGEFDEEKFAADLGDRIPALYARQGYVDFQVVKDTVIIDRERGKAMIELTVAEGPRYRVGTFEVSGNQRFNTEELARYYPFTRQAPSLSQRVSSMVKRRTAPTDVFDRSKWEDATQKVSTAYNNEGYIYAQVRPVVERQGTATDSAPTVNLRWDIDERSPAIVNRIEIAGNDYTTESCIRSALLILPGSVYNQDAIIRSWQNLGNLGYFEAPLPQPDIHPNEQQDVDITFKVKEKRTGNVNFGASMGQGTGGIGGFIGLDQPNLFGQCKRGSVQWQFGQYVNDFNLSYTDPAVRQSQVSATTTAYSSRSRYTVSDLGTFTKTGGSLRLGFPVPRSYYSRLGVSYGVEGLKYGQNGLAGAIATTYPNSIRSTLGFDAQHDTRIDMPFATAGGLQSVTAEFNGGPLGGTANFQRYTGELRTYAPLGEFGGKGPGAQPIKFVLGLKSRAGAVFGDPAGFFIYQKFALGGVQYGEQLRGYPEFSITPAGYVTSTSTYNAKPESFGGAFFTTTAELGMRVNQAVYVDGFIDAGNLWNRPREFDPTRLFRGAGIGVSTVTPLGPLGLDWAYGFDRRDVNNRPAPAWQLHFRLGQLF